jgi:hypothetical protein
MPDALSLAFAPLHKRAFGIAIAATGAVILFVVTAVAVLRGEDFTLPLGLLAEYFPGYAVSWRGAWLGAGWAAMVGFAAGWLLALARNTVLAIMLFTIRTRAELASTRDFLDHI